MDIVIPLGSGSPWNDNELRYTLRGIEKHLKGYDKIYLVGNKPGWIQNVVHIHFREVHLCAQREKNICNKVLAAIDDGVSDEFMFINDDHFLLVDFTAENLPFFHGGPVKEKLQEVNPFNPYGKTIQNTIKLFGDQFNNYDIHCPVIFRKNDFKKVMECVDWEKPYGYLMKTIYCHTYNVQGRFLKDCKINKGLTWEEIMHTINGRPFFSIGNAGLNDDMKAVLNDLYPNPSNYEIMS